MKHRTLFLIGSIILLVYGLMWFVFPTFGLSMHGHEVVANDLPSGIARYWGSAYLALAVVLWLAKDGDADSIAVRAILAGGVVMCVLGLIAAIMDIIYAKPNEMIWVAVGLYVLFGVWFIALLFGKKT